MHWRKHMSFYKRNIANNVDNIKQLWKSGQIHCSTYLKLNIVHSSLRLRPYDREEGKKYIFFFWGPLFSSGCITKLYTYTWCSMCRKFLFAEKFWSWILLAKLTRRNHMAQNRTEWFFKSNIKMHEDTRLLLLIIGHYKITPCLFSYIGNTVSLNKWQVTAC